VGRGDLTRVRVYVSRRGQVDGEIRVVTLTGGGWWGGRRRLAIEVARSVDRGRFFQMACGMGGIAALSDSGVSSARPWHRRWDSRPATRGPVMGETLGTTLLRIEVFARARQTSSICSRARADGWTSFFRRSQDVAVLVTQPRAVVG